MCLQSQVYAHDSRHGSVSPRCFSSSVSFKDGSSYPSIPPLAEERIMGSTVQKTMKMRLDNGMQVYLISDPQAAESAAAVSVRVGNWNDPREVPGMAHFVEHLLFMGSKKFPRKSDFFKYISDRRGRLQGTTFPTTTLYGFSIGHEGFEGGLDRFSRFFIDPLFACSSIYREKHTVDHEFQDDLENNIRKIEHLIKAIGNPAHPNALFSCGNLTSLDPVSQIAVRQWYADHYVGSNMHLVVLSPLPLDQLSNLVVQFFSPISGNSPKTTKCEEPLSSSVYYGHCIHLQPCCHARHLSMLWEVPRSLLKRLGVMPIEIAKLAINHNERRSLSDLLGCAGLASGASIREWQYAKDRIFFDVAVSLTRQGVLEVDEVISTCFQALQGLGKKGAFQSLQTYLIEQEETRRKDHTMLDRVIAHSSSLVDEPIEAYPSARSSLQRISETDLVEFLSGLTPDKCLFFLLDASIELGIEMSQLEGWMGTLYQVKEVPPEKLLDWSHLLDHEGITIRESITEENADKQGTVYQERKEWEQGRVSVEFVKDPSLSADTMKARFVLKPPVLMRDVRYEACGRLWLNSIWKRINAYSFREAHILLNVDLHLYDDRIEMSLESVGENALDGLREYLAVAMDYSISSDLFEEVRSSVVDADPGDPAPS